MGNRAFPTRVTLYEPIGHPLFVRLSRKPGTKRVRRIVASETSKANALAKAPVYLFWRAVENRLRGECYSARGAFRSVKLAPLFKSVHGAVRAVMLARNRNPCGFGFAPLKNHFNAFVALLNMSPFESAQIISTKRAPPSEQQQRAITAREQHGAIPVYARTRAHVRAREIHNALELAREKRLRLSRSRMLVESGFAPCGKHWPRTARVRYRLDAFGERIDALQHA